MGSGGGTVGTGTGGAMQGGGGQEPTDGGGAGGSFGAGGFPPVTTIKIAHVSTTEAMAMPYEGDCTAGIWSGLHNEFGWSNDGGIDATCKLAWGSQVDAPTRRTIYGCCQVDVPSLRVESPPCHPLNTDGLEYLFAKEADESTRTSVILSAFGSECDNGMVGVTLVDGGPNMLAPADQINCFTPVLDGGCPAPANAQRFYLEWAVDLDDAFSSVGKAHCTLGVRWQAPPPDGGTYGQVTLNDRVSMFDKNSWVTCIFDQQ
jgi:hypothetical protein